MSLNIKNPTTHRLVRELAAATGMSQTAAVEDAVRRRLAEVAGESAAGEAEAQRRLERLQRIARAYAADLTDDDRDRIRSADAWLYDESGLPR